VDRNEQRHRVVATLLQADGPLGLEQIVARCDMAAEHVQSVLAELVGRGQVVAGELVPGLPAPQYRWAARWRKEAHRRVAASRQDLRAAVPSFEILPEHKLEIDSGPVAAFHNYILNEYVPPAGKRFLVFLQCSVRRPFSKSPSHASMKRAIRLAVGADPAGDFEACCVHVVVLASRIGPVPYELEDVYPANVGGGGVKHFRDEHYGRVRPILARRMAQYITRHGEHYERIATFTHGRYGEVMADAREIAGLDFPIFPAGDGPRVIEVGSSRPRTYWQKFWIQLYLEIVRWLPRALRARAAERLGKLEVKYR